MHVVLWLMQNFQFPANYHGVKKKKNYHENIDLLKH